MRFAQPPEEEVQPPEEEVQPIELTQEQEKLVLEAQRQQIKALALNNILDTIFFAALKKEDFDICKNLRSAIVRGDERNSVNIAAILDIVQTYNKQGGSVEAAYPLLKNKFDQYKIVKWVTGGTAIKNVTKWLDLWIETIPSLALLIAAENSGIPTDEQERQSGLYYTGENQGTNELRVSKAIMLMRSAKSLLYEPEGAIKTPTPLMAFGNVDAIYQALRAGLLDNNFIIAPDTKFDLQGQKYTLNELDTQLAQIIKDELIRVMMENEELARQGYKKFVPGA